MIDAAEEPDTKIETTFVAVMELIRALPTEQARFTVSNWVFEALDQREGALSEPGEGGYRKASQPAPGVYGVKHADILLTKRFMSMGAANKWANENYRGGSFEIVKIA